MTTVCGFLLLIIGFLGVYWELVRPGLMVPGLVGCVVAIAGAYFLWRNAPTRVGMALIGLAVLLFVAEVFWRAPLVAGMCATVALTFGFCLLFPISRRIPAELAIPVSVIFGGITSLLAYGAKRARRNKWAELQSRK